MMEKIILYRHPLDDNKWCVLIKDSYIPPYIGTLKQCIKAKAFAENKLKNHE